MKRTTKKRKPAKRAARRSSLAPRVISFRLDEKESEQLDAKAKDQGLSSHQLAHDLVLTTMQQEADGKSSNLKLDKIETRIKSLRAELCLVTEVLLVGGGKATKEQAANWVDTNLKPENDMTG